MEGFNSTKTQTHHRGRRLFAERRSDGNPTTAPPLKQPDEDDKRKTSTNFMEMLDRFRYTPCVSDKKAEGEGEVLKTRKRKIEKDVKVRVVSPYFPLPKSVQQGEVIVVAKKKPNKPPRRNTNTNINTINTINKKKKQLITSRPLSAAERVNQAYRRKQPNNTWRPPPSPHKLIQENHYHDPWKVLIICILLNRTTGQQLKSGGITSKLFRLCPDAKTAVEVATEDIERVIKRLGLYKKRAKIIQQFSQEYLEEGWTHVTQLHGIGKYAADAYAIFCTGEWDKIKPEDHMLDKYWEYLCWLREYSDSPYWGRKSSKGRGRGGSDDDDGEISHAVAGGTE